MLQRGNMLTHKTRTTNEHPKLHTRQDIDFGFLKENIRAIQEKVWCCPSPYIFKAFNDERLSLHATVNIRKRGYRMTFTNNINCQTIHNLNWTVIYRILKNPIPLCML